MNYRESLFIQEVVDLLDEEYLDWIRRWDVRVEDFIKDGDRPIDTARRIDDWLRRAISDHFYEVEENRATGN